MFKVILPLCLSLIYIQGFSQRIYWTEPGSGEIRGGNLKPTLIEQDAFPLATGLDVSGNPASLAIDPENGSRIFYLSTFGENIHSIDISDGSPISTVITTGGMVNFVDIAYSKFTDALYGTMNTEVHGVFYVPADNEDSGGDSSLPLNGLDNDDYTGIAVFEGATAATSKVYLASYDNNAIYVTNLSGTSMDIIASAPGGYQVDRVAVDAKTGKVYFTVYTSSSPWDYKIMSVNPDGSGLATTASLGTAEIRSLAVYSPYGKIYFSRTAQIQSMDLDALGNPTGSATPLAGSTSIDDIAIEADNMKPVLQTFTPLDNATNVAINPNYSLVFSEDVKISTATGTPEETSIRVYRTTGDVLDQTIPRESGSIGIGGGGSITISGAALSFLQASTDYYVRIGSKVFLDNSGNTYDGISNNTTWNFTTMPGVNITKGTASLCGSSYITLPDIVIEESQAANFMTGSATLILGFTGSTSSFVPGFGTATIVTGNDLAAASATVTATAVTITYYVSATTNIDRITISGLRISTTDPESTDDIVRTGGTGVIAGLYTDDIVGELTPQGVIAVPSISFPASNNHYCKDASLAGTVVTVTGTDVRWYGDADRTIAYPPLDGQNSVTGDELSLLSATPGTYSRYVTQMPGSCESAPAKVDIIIDPAPTPTLTGGIANACAGVSVEYMTENGMSNYAWSVTGGTVTAGGTTTSSTMTVTWGAAGAGLVSVNYNNANGCTAATPTIRNITVNDPPVPPLNGPAASCVGATGVVYSTTALMTNYTWTVSAGGTVTAGGTATSNDITVTWNTAGARGVSVNFTNANGCTGVAPTTRNVTVNTAPTVSLAGPTAVCAGSTGVVYTTEDGQSNYDWIVSGGGTIAAGGTSSSRTVTVTWNSTGNRTVSVNYENASGCPATSPKVLDVLVVAEPTMPLAGDDQVVCGASATLAGNTPVVGTGLWTVVTGTGGSFTDDTSPTSSFTGSVDNTYVLRWSISSANCATNQDEVSITLQAPPTAAAAGTTQNICGTSTTLAGNAPTIGTGVWTIQGGAGGNVTTPASPTSTFTGIAGNSYVLRWTTSNGVCPVSQSDVTINLFGTPTTAAAGSPQTLCAASTTLAGNTPTTGTGLWTVDSGTGGSFGNNTSPTSSFTGVAGTSYTLRWTISNGTCTASSNTVSIGFVANPTTASAGLDQQPCGTTTTLAGNTPTIGTGAWSIIKGAGGTLAAPANATSAFHGNPGVLYTLRWTISNTGCPVSEEEVDINFIEPPTTAQAGADISVCGTATTLAANTATSGLGIWSIISGGGGQIVNPSSPTSAFNGVAGNTYVLRWTVAKTGCTTTTDEVGVQMKALPVGNGSLAGLASICPGISSTYQVSGIANAASYEWSIPTGFELLSENGTTAELKAVSGSGGTLSVKGVNDCGTSNIATLDVAILPAPAVSIQLPGGAVVDDPLSFSFTSPGSLSNPSWSFGDEGTSTDTNPTHTYTQPGDYEVVLLVGDGIGCQGQDSKTLKVLPEAELSNHSIKNVVTANGDGQNGVLYIDRIERFPESEVVVLDRWGVEVFRRTNYVNDWDFRRGEEFVPAGSYICLVKYQGKVYSRNVTVLKGK